MSNDIKKAAEHIIALYNRLDISDSDESRRVAGAYLSLREQVETVALPALQSNFGDIEKINELAKALGVMPFTHMETETKDAVNAIEDGR